MFMLADRNFHHVANLVIIFVKFLDFVALAEA